MAASIAATRSSTSASPCSSQLGAPIDERGFPLETLGTYGETKRRERCPRSREFLLCPGLLQREIGTGELDERGTRTHHVSRPHTHGSHPSGDGRFDLLNLVGGQLSPAAHFDRQRSPLDRGGYEQIGVHHRCGGLQASQVRGDGEQGDAEVEDLVAAMDAATAIEEQIRVEEEMLAL
ncbi:MAG: hypothetical protein P8049_10335, partial [Gemmatimonadota bacterium]